MPMGFFNISLIYMPKGFFNLSLIHMPMGLRMGIVLAAGPFVAGIFLTRSHFSGQLTVL